jgi:hypothetical protein
MSSSYAKNKLPLPKDCIPEPIFDAKPEFVELYWTAWQYAWDHVIEREGAPQSPYMDEAFERNTIWIWDTTFMALFCKYAPHIFPGVQSLDNFYVPIHDGVVSPLLIQHPDNPPLFAWVELENARFTGDLKRLQSVWEKQYLQKHYAFFNSQPTPRTSTAPFARYHNDLHWTGTGYLWSGVASGMDNTPRGRGTHPHGYDGHERILWADALAQQGLAARCMAEIAAIFGDTEQENFYRQEHAKHKELSNRLYWDETDGFYADLLAEDSTQKIKVLTPATYWGLLAGFCSTQQAQRLAAHAENPAIFGGQIPLPTVARNDPDYNPEGQYWRGGVWLPTAYMSIKALEQGGFSDLADTLARRLVQHMQNTFAQFEPASIWECYNPETPKPATGKDNEPHYRGEFCGWSALGPISLFIENILGFRHVDSIHKTIEWNCKQPGRYGIKNLRLGSCLIDLIHEENGSISINSQGTFTLVVGETKYEINPGQTTLRF